MNADDDFRISRIVRHLLEESNDCIKLELCKKLEVAVKSPSNVQYVCRSFQRLAENMLSIMKVGSNECAEAASTILGLMCYINRMDFYKWNRILFDEFDRCNSYKIKKCTMLVIQTVLSYDANDLELALHSAELMSNLKERLENASVGRDFMIVSETIVHFAKCYKSEFVKHFTDFVDIIVGWHLEIDQPPALKMHCSIVLQKFASYFLNELHFTGGLLEQFLEDIAVCGEHVIDDNMSNDDRIQAEMRLGAFVGTLNTVIKALLCVKPSMSGFFPHKGDLIKKSFEIITSTAVQTLNLKLCTEETIINLNEFFFIIFNYFPRRILSDANKQIVESIVKQQIDECSLFSNQQKLSLLSLLLCIVRELGNSLPLSMVVLICTRLNAMKLTRNKRVYKLLLRIYHEVLLLKNVALVQKTYAQLTYNKEWQAIHCTKPREAVKIIFDVAAISVLAMQTSSMISMHALNPPIYHLLCFELHVLDLPCYIKRNTILYCAIMRVFVLHCWKHRQFMDSSYFFTEQFMSTHSANHFSQILGLLRYFVNVGECKFGMPVYNTQMMLNWTCTLLKQCTHCVSVLWKESNFTELCNTLCDPKVVLATTLPLKHAACIQVILTFNPRPPQDLLKRICLLAHTILVHYHGKHNEKIQQNYTQILARLPLSITLTPHMMSMQLPQYKLHLAHERYKSTDQNALLRSKYFKPLLENIGVISPLANEQIKSTRQSIHELFYGYFIRCCPLNMLSSKKTSEYYTITQNNPQLLYAWLQYEAARYCVDNKLRTTIGKPQETFLAIEAIIMRYARVFSMHSSLLPKLICEKRNVYDFWVNNIQLLSHSRQILGFLEELEKCIYNAGEGCAFALLPTEKAAKTFFRINAHTCQEWFKRINSAMCLIALNGMNPEMCIRYCEDFLRADKLQSLRFEHTITSLTWALLNCGESTALHGLYIWLHSKLGKRYVWIQHAANQACGRRELAADGYLTVLKDADTGSNTNSKIDTYLREFLIEQLFECLYSTAQWEKLRNLQSLWSIQMRSSNHLQIMEMLCYGGDDLIDENLSNISSLTEWDITQPSQQKTLNNSSMILLCQLEDACLAQIIKRDESQEAKEHLNAAIQNALLESINHGTFNGHLNKMQTNCLILNYIMGAQKWKTEIEQDAEIYRKMNSGVVLKCLLWSRLLSKTISCTDSTLYNLHLDVATAARHEGNLQLCKTMLNRFFELHDVKTTTTCITMQLQNDSYQLDIKDDLLLRALAELTECMNVSQHEIDAINLASAYCRQIIQQLPQMENIAVATSTSAATAASQMLLRLTEWLQCQQRNNSSLVCNLSQLQRLLSHLPIDYDIKNGDATQIPTLEHAMGRLIYGSIAHRHDIAEAWYVYGNLCYRWGKRVFEFRTKQNVGGMSLQDRDAIRNILHGEEQIALLDQIEFMLNGQKFGAYDSIIGEEEEKTEEPDGDDESPETIDDYNSCEKLRSDLLKLDVLNTEQIAEIVRIWRQTHGNVYYETAMRAYFRFLAIAAETASNTHMNFEKMSITTMDCMFVTTTLRILRLIVKHALGLQDALEEVLHNTPMRPWKAIIPQLFSRLNHNEPYVRNIVSELLCKLSRMYSNLVLYPAAIGAMQERPPEIPDAATALECNLQQRKRNSFEMNILSNRNYPFNSLLYSCGAKDDIAVLQKLVKELKRITLLWEEYWLHSLAQLCADYGPLFNKIELQSKQSSYASLNIHYMIIVEHLIADLRRIYSVTQCEPGSLHERNFQKRYNILIESTITALQNDYENARRKDSNLKPYESWSRLKQLYGVFQQRLLRTNITSLKLADISPWLSRSHENYVNIPGENKYIKAVDSSVQILPTKTRPKKLSFLGDDGCYYTYLFKGLEDLHLDERIMQFLSIANSMMIRHSEQSTSVGPNLCAQHYTVIPLGQQSGIIRWVDGMTPLFSIYKKWQQRDVAFKQQQKDRQQSSIQPQITTANAVVGTRPSDLFHGKLAPLLAERNLKVSDPRRQWPLDVLRRVLIDLTKNTPRDLLAKELWCSAFNATKWREVVRNYTASVAVMSVIGYVIGLGDRHLDNILIKLSSGELLHIDYNVSFEKGKTLRVPERVPFRMTPNIEEALGLTGIEGTFRLTCENVLRILRKERETLLTLLEAFVYDPLIDWTVNDEDAAAVARITSAHVAMAHIECYENASSSTNQSSTLEKATSKQIDTVNEAWMTPNISVNFSKLRPNWIKFKNEVECELRKIESYLCRIQNTQEMIEQEEIKYDSFNKQLAMVHELKSLNTTITNHPLNTASSRYANYKRAVENFNDVKNKIERQHQKIQNRLSIINGSEVEFATLTERLSHFKRNDTHKKLSEQLELFDEVEEQRKEVEQYFKLLLDHQLIRKYVPRTREEKQNVMIQCNDWYHQLLSCTNDVATLQSNILEWHEELIINNSNVIKYASEFQESTLSTSDKDLEYTNIYSYESSDISELSNNLQSILSTGNSDDIMFLQNAILQLIEDQGKTNFIGFVSNDLGSLNVYIERIKYVKSIFEVIPLPSVLNSSEQFTAINLLHATIQSLCALRDEFEIPLFDRIVQMLMRDDRDELQLLMQQMCQNTTHSQELLKNVDYNDIYGENGDFYSLLRDINKLFTDFESKLTQLLTAARTIFRQLEQQLDDSLKKLESYIFDKNLRVKIDNCRYDMIAQAFESAQSFVNNMNTHTGDIVNNILYSCSSALSQYITYFQYSLIHDIAALFMHALHVNLKSAFSLQLNTITHQQSVHDVKSYWKRFVDALNNSCMFELCQKEKKVRANRLSHHKIILQAYCWINNIDAHEFSEDLSITPIKNIYKELDKIRNTFMLYHTALEQFIKTHPQEMADMDLLNIEMDRNRFYIHLCQQMHKHNDALMCYKEMGIDEVLTQLDEWQSSFTNWTHSVSLITPTEKDLVQLLDPEDNIDEYWVKNINSLLDEIIFTKQRNITTMEQKINDIYSQLNASNYQLQFINDAQEQCVCNLFKLMLKSKTITLYRRDKQFHSELNKILLQLKCVTRKSSISTIVELRITTEKLIELVVQNREDILAFIERLIKGESQQQPVHSLHNKSNTSELNDLGHTEKRAYNNQNEQKRNAYAVSVWKRIRMKLEGRDPTPNSRSTVTEQVDFIIREAMNIDNLAVLYEGWTPWV